MDSTHILNVSATPKWRIDNYNYSVYDTMANLRVIKKYDLDSETLQNKHSENNAILKEYQEFNSEYKKFIITLPEKLSDFSKACVG